MGVSEKTAEIVATPDLGLTSWVGAANEGSPFPIQNLPFGLFSRAGGRPRSGVAIGGQILDLAAAADILTGEALKAAQAAAGER